MASKLKAQAAKAIMEWCAKIGKASDGEVRHVHPRALVLGKAAPLCLIVRLPWQDSEPQCQAFKKRHALSVVHTFDPELDEGMWCATGYVTRGGCSETVAVRFDA